MCCQFYGGMPNVWLDLPVKTFFAMYREAIKMEARQFSELADIALVANMKLEYYLELKHRYRHIISPEAPRLPEKPGGPVFDSGSMDARSAMFRVGQKMKHYMGYGERR